MGLIDEGCYGAGCQRSYQAYSFAKNKVLSSAKSSASLTFFVEPLNKNFYQVFRQFPSSLPMSIEFHSFDETTKPFVLESPFARLGRYWVSEEGVLSYLSEDGTIVFRKDLRSSQSVSKELHSLKGLQSAEFMKNEILRAYKDGCYKIINIDKDTVDASYPENYNGYQSQEISLDKKFVVFSYSDRAELINIKTKNKILTGTDTGSWKINGSQEASVHFLNRFGDILWGEVGQSQPTIYTH